MRLQWAVEVVQVQARHVRGHQDVLLHLWGLPGSSAVPVLKHAACRTADLRSESDEGRFGSADAPHSVRVLDAVHAIQSLDGLRGGLQEKTNCAEDLDLIQRGSGASRCVRRVAH